MKKTKAMFLAVGQPFKIAGLEDQMKNLTISRAGVYSCSVDGEIKNAEGNWIKVKNYAIAPSTEVVVSAAKTNSKRGRTARKSG